MRKRREALTIPLLIGREAWAPPAPAARASGPRGRAETPMPDLRMRRKDDSGEERLAESTCPEPPLWFVPPAGV